MDVFDVYLFNLLTDVQKYVAKNLSLNSQASQSNVSLTTAAAEAILMVNNFVGAPLVVPAEGPNPERNSNNENGSVDPNNDNDLESAAVPDPLEYWADKNCALSVVAKRFLSITATSAPSERIFSGTGLTMSSRRTTLSAEHLAELSFVNKNHLLNN